MKKIADEAVWEKDHPPSQEERANKRQKVEEATAKYAEHITQPGAGAAPLRCSKDYSTICPVGFVAA